MKRLICAVLTAILIAASPAYALSGAAISSDAHAYLLMDLNSHTVIAEKNAYEALDPAGLVRLPALLTACEAFDNGSADESAVTVVSREASQIKGSTAFIAENEHIRLGELLKAAVVINAGDALLSLLMGIFGSEASILEAESACMTRLGLSSPSNALGRGDTYSLFDLAKVCIALSESPAFLKYSSVYTDTLPHEKAPATELTNPNRLVRFYSGCFGIATGSVGQTDYCGAFAARRGSSSFLALVAGAPDSSSRFKTAQDLLDHAFSNYRHFSLFEECEIMGQVTVTGGIKTSVPAVTASRIDLLVPVNCKKLVSEAVLPELIEAPVVKGAHIGDLIIKDSEGNTAASLPLVAAESVEKALFSDWFGLIAASWLGGFTAGPWD